MNDVNVNDETMPVVLGADNLVQMADMAEKRVQAIKRIKQAALSVTSKHDWVDQGGKPYLQVSGSEKIARLFGISWTIDEPILTTEEDGHFSYTYKGAFTIGTTPPIDFIGSRGSKDLFFSKSHGDSIPPSEIDRNDVKKSAYTNLLGNGITRLLGLRNLTWEEVEAALNIKRENMGKVDYGKKEMSEDAKDLRNKIKDMLTEMAIASKTDFSKLLMLYTSFVGKDGKEVRGKSSLDAISEKAIPVTYSKIKEAYESLKGGAKDAGSTDKDEDFEQSEFDK
jgi:hypothetical protein